MNPDICKSVPTFIIELAAYWRENLCALMISLKRTSYLLKRKQYSNVDGITGRHLVEFQTRSKMLYLGRTFMLTDDGREGAFIWVAGEAILFTNWASAGTSLPKNCGRDRGTAFNSGPRSIRGCPRQASQSLPVPGVLW